MKFLAALMLLTSFSVFADATCTGTKDGKEVIFTLSESADMLNVNGLSVSIDGQRVNRSLPNIRVTPLAGGVMITAEPANSFGINTISVFMDEATENRGAYYMGWINLYDQDLIMTGIELKCE